MLQRLSLNHFHFPNHFIFFTLLQLQAATAALRVMTFIMIVVMMMVGLGCASISSFLDVSFDYCNSLSAGSKKITVLLKLDFSCKHVEKSQDNVNWTGWTVDGDD